MRIIKNIKGFIYNIITPGQFGQRQSLVAGISNKINTPLSNGLVNRGLRVYLNLSTKLMSPALLLSLLHSVSRQGRKGT
jgi:hypothetical protein